MSTKESLSGGRVLGVYNKEWGSTTLWSFKLEGVEVFYRCGRVQPDIQKGQTVEFKHDAKMNVDMSTLKVITDAPAEPQKPKHGPPAGGASSSETQSAVNSRLKYQAARADAARIVAAAMHNDHLPFASNTAKGKRLDLVVGYVEAVTKQLIEQEENNS